MAKPSLMDWLLDPKSSEEDYQEIRKNKKVREAAASLNDVIGGRAVEGKAAQNLADLGIFEGMDIDKTPVMTEAVQGQDASGMMARSSPEMQNQLTTIQDMINSGNPAISEMGMTQMDEMVRPPAQRAPVQQTTDIRDYEYGLENPGFAEAELARAKAAGGVGGMSFTDLKSIGIEDAEGNVRANNDPFLTAEQMRQGKGLAPGESYSFLNPTQAETDRTRDAALSIYDEMDQLLISGENPIFGDDYDSSLKGQIKSGIAWMTQSDPRLPEYVDFAKGVSGQLARVVGGEKGALRDEDIERVIQGLLPKISHLGANGLPVKGDTTAVAKSKMRRLRRMMNLPTRDLNEWLIDEYTEISSDDDDIYVWDAELGKPVIWDGKD